jgi:hypothetical protein
VLLKPSQPHHAISIPNGYHVQNNYATANAAPGARPLCLLPNTPLRFCAHPGLQCRRRRAPLHCRPPVGRFDTAAVDTPPAIRVEVPETLDPSEPYAICESLEKYTAALKEAGGGGVGGMVRPSSLANCAFAVPSWIPPPAQLLRFVRAIHPYWKEHRVEQDGC